MKNPYVRLMHSLWHYGAAWRVSIVGYYCLFAAAELVAGFCPYFFGRAFNALQTTSKTILYDGVFWLAMVMFGYFVSSMFQLPGLIMERIIAFRIKEHFLLTVYTDVTHLPLAWHQRNHSGGILTSINRAAMGLYDFARKQDMYFQSILRLAVSIGFLFWISLPLGIVAISVPTLIAAVGFLFDKKLVSLYETRNGLENRIGAVLFEYINNMITILTLRLGALSRASLLKHIDGVRSPFRKEVFLRETKQQVFGTLLTTSLFLILIGYVVYAMKTTGTIELGLFIMIGRYQSEMNGVFRHLVSDYNDIVRMSADMEGVHPLLTDIERYAQVPYAITTELQNWQLLTLSHLTFSHGDAARNSMFTDLSLTIQRKQKIALIGTSGGGKSSLLNLLRGLYVPSSGVLTIDGVAFDSLEPLYKMTTLIPQDPELFADDIAFNVTFGASIENKEVERMLQLAGFSEILATLPQGLRTHMQEKGVNFSVGQKQRLGVARGLFAARQSSIVLMDEPTSSVDLVTEKKILTGIFSALPEATCIVSLHRLHLLPNFDAVIMLQEGKIVAAGPVAELLHVQGPVRDMWLEYQR